MAIISYATNSGLCVLGGVFAWVYCSAHAYQSVFVSVYAAESSGGRNLLHVLFLSITSL